MASPLPAWASFACGGVAACVAEVVTLPIDTCKVRLQLLRKGAAAGGAAAPSLGMLGMFGKVAAEEGVAGLYKGMVPALQRQLVFASLRVGIYSEISERLREPGQTTLSLGRKILAGLLSGALGITCVAALRCRIANPTDLVKVRMQSEGRLAAGQKPRYAGVMDAYRTIVRAEGLAGLWTGLGPAIARNSVINATELATYEQCKEALLARGAADGLPVHVAAGVGAGAMATLLGSPVDVVKTRVMSSGTPGAPVYAGALDCLVRTARQEGLGAFYQGVAPQFFRLTGWSVVMFVTLEQLKGGVGRLLSR